MKDYKKYYIGSYPDEISAALAYDQKARELFGKHCKLNFPHEDELPPAVPPEILKQILCKDKFNIKRSSRNTANPYLGVNPSDKSWTYEYYANRKRYYKGKYNSAYEAALARDISILKHGHRNNLNILPRID